YPGQGKWRVYDKPYNERFVIKTGSASKEKYVEHPAHSLTFNITMPNAAFLPAGAKTVKLDIHINFFSSLDTVPKWVKEWDKSKSPDLLNMLSVVYDYQKQSGNSENSFTVYIGVR
ncbi:MAG: hypothetical protein LBB91_07685, partial [Clostridiales bacterium]|nr:hypothetical protein [Clostridiales bacterium]